MKPKIVLVHYHLKTGGVTTVLRQQAESLHSDCNVLILTGSPPETPIQIPVKVIDGIGYDRAGVPSPAPESVAEAIATTVSSHFNGPCDVFHVHNPTLAKNKNFLKILKILQHKGIKLFLQIHDFAEDGRPQAYFAEPYPRDCHYGAINSRDRDVLLASGLTTEGTHLLFNSVKAFDFPADHAETTSLVLYPIRAIRRKNIGEAILLSLFFEHGETLAITRPPNSPADFPAYEGWKSFVSQNRLKVLFEAGLTYAFSDLVRTAKFFITTSITEGFGFSFLEPWLGAKALWGRKIPEICRDFEQKGIRFPHLYTELAVPLDWLDRKMFERLWTTCVKRNCVRYGLHMAEEAITAALLKITAHDRVDFSCLNESFQKKIIKRVIEDRQARREMLRLNPSLSGIGQAAELDRLIAENRRAVETHFHPSIYKKRLMNVYDQVMRRQVKQRIDKQVLLRRFLNLSTFSLIKWCHDA